MNARAVLLPLVALVLAAGLVAVHLAEGGNDYVPLRTADPCVERPLPPVTADLEPITEAVVLVGLQRAACKLGVPRERLVLALPSAQRRAELAEEIGRRESVIAPAIKAGLIHAVTRLDRGGRLPRASSLLDRNVEDLGLPSLADSAIRALPDGVVDDLLLTGAVLRRAIIRLDVDAALRDIDDPDKLQVTLRREIRDAALAEARRRLLDKLPGPIQALVKRFF